MEATAAAQSFIAAQLHMENERDSTPRRVVGLHLISPQESVAGRSDPTRKSTWRFTTLRRHRRRTSLLKDEDLPIHTPTEQPKRRLEALWSSGSWTQPESKPSSMIPRSTTVTRSSSTAWTHMLIRSSDTADRRILRKQTPADPRPSTIAYATMQSSVSSLASIN